MVSTGRYEGRNGPISVSELLAQDALFQAVAGVEQHPHRDGLVREHLDAGADHVCVQVLIGADVDDDLAVLASIAPVVLGL